MASQDEMAAVPAFGPRLTKTTGGSTSVAASVAEERAVTATKAGTPGASDRSTARKESARVVMICSSDALSV